MICKYICVIFVTSMFAFAVPNMKRMEKKAGGEIAAFKESVFPEGYTGASAAAPKRPAASGAAAAAKKIKVDPATMDVKQLALSDSVRRSRALLLNTLLVD